LNKYWGEVLNRLDLTPEGAWLVYLAGAVLMPLSLVLKKHLKWKEWYVTFMVLGSIGWLGNILFFYQLDLLDSGKPSIGSIPDTIMFFITPACVGVIFFNFFTSIRYKWVVSATFTIGSLIAEYLLVIVGFLGQKGWEIWYSIPIYIVLYFLFLPWHIKFVRDKS
jgi:hypothetical protein